MAAITSLSFSAVFDKKVSVSSTRTFISTFDSVRLRSNFGLHLSAAAVKATNSTSGLIIQCLSATSDAPPVSETKLSFLRAYKRPIPSIYNNVLQELIVQQHLTRYKRTYKYDPVFALGFVTIYDQLMEGYPSEGDRSAIFEAYIKALNEDPEQYRKDAQKLEEWARAQTPASLVEFSSREGEIEDILKNIAERAGGNEFSYSRFFAVGLFRLLELANASEPTILEKLCSALNVNKKNVDRDLDVYRNLLSKLVQAKELLKEYVEREKKKRSERAEVKQANEAMTK